MTQANDISLPDGPSESAAVSRPSGRSRRGVLIAAAALVALVTLFVVARSDAKDQAERAEELQPTSTPTPGPTPVFSESVAAALADSTVNDFIPQRLTGPVLGDESGLWLFYGGQDQLQRLTLDTGRIDGWGVRAVPIAATGGELILMTHDSGAIGRVDLTDPIEQAEGWVEGRVARVTEPGFLWLYAADDETWSKFDVATNMIVERRTARDQVLPARRPDHQHSIVPGPDFVTTPSGIYEFINGQYVRQLVGRGLAQTQVEVLVAACGAQLTSCSTSWLDRAAFEVTATRSPGGLITSAQLVGGEAWLHVLTKTGRSFLQSMDDGEQYELGANTVSIAVSPDGLWLAALRRDGGIDITHLSSGETLNRLRPFDDSLGGALLFVEIPTDLD